MAPSSSAAVARIERRRRENRGAIGAEGERCGEGCPPRNRENFLILALRMVGFGSFWVVFFKVELFVLHVKISVLRLPKLAIARYAVPQFFFYFGLSKWCFVAIYSPSLQNLSWHF